VKPEQCSGIQENVHGSRRGVMSVQVPTRRPGLVSILCSGLLALGFLLLVMQAPPRSPRVEESSVTSLPRRHVVIFLVDTSDYFDAHGLYVQSVIRQYCSACDVRQVNLHGDVSIPTILEALHRVRAMSRDFDEVTTVLLNLSLGTYAYDRVLHDLVRALDAQGVTIIASAGNDNVSKPFYPAAFKEVLGVCSSTRYTKTKAAYSNFGDWVSLCAPGLHYVTRPLQQGGLASGTSFASPMVAGVLGQLLLQAPCASPSSGRKALLRTADPPADRQHLGVGLLNPDAAAHYLRTLYACDSSGGFWYSLFSRVRHFTTGVLTYLGLFVYFLLSVFAFPFLLAFVIETLQRRAARRQQHAVQLAYTGSSDYRRQRLLACKQHWQRTGKIRQRQQAELVALLHALHMHGEPCWWCDKPEDGPPCISMLTEEPEMCSRCGMTLSALTSLV
jgi:Subtilase family